MSVKEVTLQIDGIVATYQMGDAGKVTVGPEYRGGCPEHQPVNIIRCGHLGDRVLTLFERDWEHWLKRENRATRWALEFSVTRLAPGVDPLSVFLASERDWLLADAPSDEPGGAQ